jgi:hypothetical protein
MCRTGVSVRGSSNLAVHFVVGLGGGVEQVSLRGSVADDELLRCVSSVFERMVFPSPPTGAVRVSVPIVFGDEGL